MWKSTSHFSVAAQHEAMAVSQSINNSVKSSVFDVFESNGVSCTQLVSCSMFMQIKTDVKLQMQQRAM